MNIVHSLIFTLVVIFNPIEISSASSPPHEIDFVSKFDQWNEHGSHQASSSHSHLTGEGLPQTELRVNSYPGTYMHFYLDPQKPSAIPQIPTDFTPQVEVNHQNVPSTMMTCDKAIFHFMSGFGYWLPVKYVRENGKLVPKTYKGNDITPGDHKVLLNNCQEAVAYELNKDKCSYITYQGKKVALRWERRKLGVRILEPAEKTFLNHLGAFREILLQNSQRRY